MCVDVMCVQVCHVLSGSSYDISLSLVSGHHQVHTGGPQGLQAAGHQYGEDEGAGQLHRHTGEGVPDQEVLGEPQEQSSGFGRKCQPRRWGGGGGGGGSLLPPPPPPPCSERVTSWSFLCW